MQDCSLTTSMLQQTQTRRCHQAEEGPGRHSVHRTLTRSEEGHGAWSRLRWRQGYRAWSDHDTCIVLITHGVAMFISSPASSAPCPHGGSRWLAEGRRNDHARSKHLLEPMLRQRFCSFRLPRLQHGGWVGPAVLCSALWCESTWTLPVQVRCEVRGRNSCPQCESEASNRLAEAWMGSER